MKPTVSVPLPPNRLSLPPAPHKKSLPSPLWRVLAEGPPISKSFELPAAEEFQSLSLETALSIVAPSV
ncbi:MAG: hypothetical protein EWV85_02915 [Microcystis aeruginosa Ma_QC_C_20070703_M131]|uniref:Uncharacterized protein n=1 Tax=Microcystis aeruginosa Ma_QC_C_20070703_M131 TaxID=2486263 RepID=A0A551YKX3_MICAE|nr:MAG: hypothetical protein EWV85_02915 [Microcystis aeruginosa Ma_QC_C_20070703_M131]